MAGYTGQLVALDTNTATEDEDAQAVADSRANQSQLARATMPADIAIKNAQATGMGLENQQRSIANQSSALTLQQQIQMNTLQNHYIQQKTGIGPDGNPIAAPGGGDQLSPAAPADSASPATSPLAGTAPATPKLPNFFDPQVEQVMQSIDPDDPQAAVKWDNAMRALARDVPQAQQFIGKFTPSSLRGWLGAIGAHVMNTATTPPLGGVTDAGASASPLAAAADATPDPAAAGAPSGSPLSTPASPLGPEGQKYLEAMSIRDPKATGEMVAMQYRMKYQQTGNPEFLRIGDPDLYEKLTTADKNSTDAQKTAITTQFDTMGRQANSVLALANQYGKDSPAVREAYNKAVIFGRDKGWIDPQTAQQELSQPIDFANLANVANVSQTVTDWMKSSGQEAANEAKARNANLPPDTQVAPQLDANGQPIFFNKNAVPPGGYGTGSIAGGGMGAPGTPSTSLTAFAGQVAAHESGGVATAQNPNSSAGGAGQFIDSTWRQTIAANRPDLVGGKTAAQIAADPQLNAKVLAMKADPNLSREMTVDFAKTNGAALQGMGVPVTGATLGAAHALGVDNLTKVLHAAPNTPLSQVLSPSVMSANPQFKNQTAGGYMQGMVGTYGNSPIPLDGSDGGGAVTGQAYLATLSPAMRNQVQAVMDGRLVLPNSGRLSPQQQVVMTNVQRADPTFDFVNAPARAAVRKDFTSGKSAQAVTAYNTAIGHLDQMDQAITGLGNTPFSWWNKPAQWLGQNVGDPHTQAAIANFNTTKGAVTSELVKALRGTGGAEADIQYWQKQFNTADSPVALHAAVQQAAHLLGSRIDAMTQQYNTGMGLAAQFPPGLTSQAVTSLRRLQSGGQTRTASSAPVTATGPNGQKVQWDGQQWRPIG